MSGLRRVNLFTLLRSDAGAAAAGGATSWGRLYAALALSCLLHAAIFFLPYFGASAATAHRLGVRSAKTEGPARILEVRLEPARGPAAALDGVSDQASSLANAPGRPDAADKPAPPRRPARGIDVAPVPAPVFYSADQLTRRPEPTAQPDLHVPRKIARLVVGAVSLRLWIDEFGNVVSVEVTKSNVPATVSDLAVEAFRGTRFKPGEIEGRSVRSRIDVDVIYDPRLTRS
ncbi:MAG: energy transducer TonB [Burkholderiales bacterium]|nr:energy transducer TonB [Burkholderiales bacterium]